MAEATLHSPEPEALTAYSLPPCAGRSSNLRPQSRSTQCSAQTASTGLTLKDRLTWPRSGQDVGRGGPENMGGIGVKAGTLTHLSSSLVRTHMSISTPEYGEPVAGWVVQGPGEQRS